MIVTEREYLKRLDIKPPPHLAKGLGYRGRRRWIQIYYEWGLVDKPVCFDGKKFHFGSRIAWDLFVQHCGFVNQCRYMGNESNSLLLDRKKQILYGGDKEEISRMFKDSDSLKLLEPDDRYKNRYKEQDYLPKFKELLGLFLRGLFVSAGVITAVAIIAKLVLIYREPGEFVRKSEQDVNKELLDDCRQQLNDNIQNYREDSHEDRYKLAPPK